jgi:predicted permease
MLAHDLRHAVRHVTATPWLTAVIVTSLAVGTGATAAVYSAVDALMFRAPRAVAEPVRLVDLYTSQGNGGTFGASSHPDFVSLSAAASLESAAAIEQREAETVRLGDVSLATRVALVTDRFWATLGTPGHTAEWARGAVLSEELWRQLGADPAAIGRSLGVNGREYRIAAIAPGGFRGLHLDRVSDVWIPLENADIKHERGYRALSIVGRLRPPASIDTLQHELDAVALNLSREFPDTNKGTVRNEEEIRRLTAATYARLDPAVRSRAAVFGGALLGGTILLLLSACVNAGSLLLSRGLARRAELTIRTAFGADRARLVRQVVLEGLLMAALGTAAGIVAAAWTAKAIPALFAPEHASLIDTRVERPVMAITAAIGLVAGLLFALVPALIATRELSPAALRADAGRLGERQSGARLRMLLVGAQLALSTIFLIGATLLVRFADASLGVDRSRAAGSLVLASIETYDREYRDKATPLLGTLASVARAGWVAVPPLGRPARREYHIQRGPLTELIEVDVNFASGGYFRAMFIPAIEGRLFKPEDEINPQDVVVINEAMAQRYYAGRALGRVLTDTAGRSAEIVGVVQTRSYRAFEPVQRPMIYFPMSRATSRGFYAVFRSHSGTESRMNGDVAAALTELGGTTKMEVLPFEAFVAKALATDRLIGTLIGICGGIALGLAVIGVYGVMIDAVRRRRREFGLRAALGAGPTDLLRVLLGSSLAPAAIGIAAGFAGAWILARVVQSVIFGLPAIDPPLVATIVVLMAVVVTVAVIGPARQALRVSPLAALRHDA